jgi:hypothetical protein
MNMFLLFVVDGKNCKTHGDDAEASSPIVSKETYYSVKRDLHCKTHGDDAEASSPIVSKETYYSVKRDLL